MSARCLLPMRITLMHSALQSQAQRRINKKTSMRIRELLARVKAFLDLYVMNTQPRFLGPQEPILAVEDPTEASNAERNIPIE